MKKLLIPCLAILLASCASGDATMEGPAKENYAATKQMLEDGKYGKATVEFEKFTSKYPYSPYSVQAELLRGFAAYKDGQYIVSEIVCEEFIRRHPRHPDVAYAKYLLAMSHYKQVSPPERDQGETKKAINAFKGLLDEHPKSQYAADGARRLQKLYNSLAQHEVDVGNFYFDKGKYVAAANRFQNVIRKYQTTPAIEEALYRLAASYSALGIKNSAHTTSKLLQHNYPNSEWSKEAERFL